MSGIRVFVNEKPVDVASPATVADAVTVLDAELGAALLSGTARATDARGIDIAPTDRVGPGSIVRFLAPRSRGARDREPPGDPSRPRREDFAPASDVAISRPGQGTAP